MVNMELKIIPLTNACILIVFVRKEISIKVVNWHNIIATTVEREFGCECLWNSKLQRVLLSQIAQCTCNVLFFGLSI